MMDYSLIANRYKCYCNSILFVLLQTNAVLAETTELFLYTPDQRISNSLQMMYFGLADKPPFCGSVR